MEPLDLEQYRALVEHGPSLLWRTGVNGRCDFVSDAWLAFTGRMRGSVIGMEWVGGVHPDDVEKSGAVFRGHLARREPFAMEYRVKRADGSTGYVFDRGVPRLDEAGAFAGFTGACMDLDHRDAASGANDFFEMSLDNVCVAGLDGYFRRVNPSWTRTLGWTADELKARPSLEFVHPDDRDAVLAGRQRLRGGASLGPLINRYVCKDGSYRWFEWRSVANVERDLVYAAARDVTEQKLAELRLRESEEMKEKLQRQLIFSDRMASVGTLAAGVGHEINNPLAGIVATIAVMIEELEELGAQPQVRDLRDMAVDVREGAERIRKIVLGLKTFSRATEDSPIVLDVHRLLELSIDMTSSEVRSKARLVKDYGTTPLVHADEAKLGQAFINLLVNAASAIPAGQAGAHEIRVATSTDVAGRAVIEVRDTGRGIPPHMIERIFEPFFTTKPVGGGTGLGLSMCHTIVTSMGGEIVVESQEGRGSTFRVVLPAHSQPSPR